MTAQLAGKVAIVTGAASGIGRATSRLFAAAGARVVVADVTESISETAALITEAGGTASAVVCDAGSEPAVRGLVEKAAALYGGVDIFHANAGVTGDSESGIFDSSAPEWLEVLRVNLVGPFLAIKYSAPVMNRRGGGSIICTASVAGLRAGAGPAPYSASKAGLINLVQSACQNLVGTNIRVNAICPGLIATAMTRHWYDGSGVPPKELTRLIPQQRGGEAEDIAAVALFLASDGSWYINGHHLVVDGGLSTAIASPWPPDPESIQALLRAQA
jgi:NAD(P)-dependent dehydrogenase (short-subunit alcohol dehydrogenase family)